MTTLTEADVESAALDWLATIGWQTAHGPDIAPDTPGAERADYGQVVLERRLRDARARLNPSLPASALDDALRKLTHPEGATLEARNRLLSPDAGSRGDGGVPGRERRHSGRAGPGH
jgi:type I restriction enzyme R subunit